MTDAAHLNATLDGQWALVTGGARRIGAVIARTLHAAGANVAVHYGSSAADADALVADLNGIRPESAFAIQADLRDDAAPEQLISGVTETAGRLDILVNNASTFYPTPIAEITEADWNDLLGTNLKSPMFLAKWAAPHLREAGGQIINIVDIHARRPLRNHPVYGPAKAGLEMLTRSLAKDLAPEVRVNGVSPGAILWPEEGMTEGAIKSIVSQIPLGRTGGPEDIARTVLFLTKDAPYITGQVIAVDGGRSVGW